MSGGATTSTYSSQTGVTRAAPRERACARPSAAGRCRCSAKRAARGRCRVSRRTLLQLIGRTRAQVDRGGAALRLDGALLAREHLPGALPQAPGFYGWHGRRLDPVLPGQGTTRLSWTRTRRGPGGSRHRGLAGHQVHCLDGPSPSGLNPCGALLRFTRFSVISPALRARRARRRADLHGGAVRQPDAPRRRSRLGR